MSKKEFRLTRQRKTILEEVSRKTGYHPTVSEVYERVKKKIPDISLGTVYRNLEVLSEQGYIQKIELSGFKRRYDANTKRHIHVRCVKCDRVDDLDINIINEEINKILAEKSDYEIIGYRVEFFGICCECKEKGIKLKK